MCNMLSIAAPLLKLITLVVHREDFFYLILYLQRKFLHGDYNDYERNIVLNCKRKCMFFTCSLTFTTLATVVSYVINPLVGKLKFIKILRYFDFFFYYFKKIKHKNKIFRKSERRFINI